jgi:ATP-binding cassette subfamily F protein 3
MLYSIKDGTVSVGGDRILSHVDFEIKGNEKIAVVGRNGAGKTTLLRLIAGELDLDRDDKRMGPGVTTSRRVTVGMLSQNNIFDMEQTPEELMLGRCQAGGRFTRERFEYEMEYDRMLTGFGFDKEDKKRKFSTFSGGQLTKLGMICLLLEKPDILLLDEPTNHLDIKTVQWLEEYLRGYPNAVVMVSHDRFFLDRVADVVYELQDGALRRYVGNYTAYREQKGKLIAAWEKAYERQQREQERLEGLVERFRHKPRKAAFARSRKSMLARMETVEKPIADEAHIFTGELEPLVLGAKWVLETEHMQIGYDKCLAELSLKIRRGQKIGIIGDNGVGKSTFLKTVAGIMEPLKGKCTLGSNVTIGYFDQQTADFQSDKTVVGHFHELYPSMTDKEARQVLGAYLFDGRKANVRLGALSGGERSRLFLCELMTARPNFLVLDEPTNHMDIPAKETLESAFRAYTGTLLFVSHDRYFLSSVADAILVFQGGEVMYYPFGYAHYLEKSREDAGGSLAAMVQAKDQAMIAGLKAVPKGERHETRQLTTEEAYFDWRRRLAAEPMEEARGRAEALRQQLDGLGQRLELTEWLRWLGASENEDVENDASLKALYAELEASYATALDEWTRCCIDWYYVE